MFGYIRPVYGELLVKEYELYRAVYCGLCRYGGEHISHFTRFFLNYDFVALALLRLSLSGEKPMIKEQRCPYHIKKKKMLSANDAYNLTCSAFAILLYYKVIDDINDSKGFKRFIKKMTKPFFLHIKNSVKEYKSMEEIIKCGLSRLQEFENSGKDNLDEVADCFAKITQSIASYGMSGQPGLIAAECGYHIGRYIYVIDALDDLVDDQKNGNYNPLIIKYGDIHGVLGNITEVEQTVTDSLNAFSSAYGLSILEKNQNRINEYDNIIFNICELGGRDALNKVINSKIKGKDI